jgi:pimeloyl-ACP methyl ester carboxylesterase
MKRYLTITAILLTCALNEAVAQQPNVKGRPTTVTASAITSTGGAWFTMNGGRFHAGDPAKPAVLLFHGLHQSSLSFTKPSARPQGDRWYFNYAKVPEKIRAVKDKPNTGIFKVGTSDRLEVDANNWFDYLKAQGYTVATWSQPGSTVGDAYPSAQQAYQQFRAATAALNPASPPRVVLLGHSRGGLLIRKLLKESGAQNRVTTVITMHSPHHGSSLANPGDNVCEVMFNQFGKIGNQVEKQLLKAAGLDKQLREFCESMNAFILDDDASRELKPDGALIQGIAQNESAVPGVKYYTFGGISPTYVRYYAWYLTAESAVPQYKVENGVPKQYFVWEAHPKEIVGLSPLFDTTGFFAPELQNGKGDGLVTDQSARLPFSTHFPTRLNHAEVLWDRPLQKQVVNLINGTPTTAVTPVRIPER